MTEQHPSTGEAPEEPRENLLSAGSMAKDAAAGAGEFFVDLVSGWLYTAGLFLSVLLALVFPLGALIVCGLLIWRAVVTDRSKFVPICIAVVAVVFWFAFKSPLGMLPLLLELL